MTTLKPHSKKLRPSNLETGDENWQQFVDSFKKRSRLLRDDTFATNPTNSTAWGNIMDNTYNWEKKFEEAPDNLFDQLITFAWVNDYSIEQLIDSMVL